MRVKVGRVVDLDKEVTLADLSPLDRIIASATSAYRNTTMYKRKAAENEERREEQRRKIRETLTDAIISAITPELLENKTLSKKGDDKCLAVLLKIPARFKSFLEDVVESHEFDAYTMTIIQPARSLSKFFDAPALLYVESKGGD